MFEFNNEVDFMKSYLTADAGEKFFIYPDGDYSRHSSGTQPSTENGCIAILTAAGIGNQDMAFWADGFAKKNDEGFWCDENGRLYTDKDLIFDGIENGDTHDILAEIVEEIERQRSEQ